MKRFALVFAVVLPVFLLVMVKSGTRGHFRNNAVKWAGSSADLSNVMTTGQLGKMGDNVLIVDMGSKGNVTGTWEKIHIPATDLLSKENQRRLRNHHGTIVLYAEDPGVLARMWMLLSQMGFKKLYMLADDTGNEVLQPVEQATSPADNH